MPFQGFPEKVDYTAIPSPFFGAPLEEIGDLGELKCALRLFHLLSRRRGPVRAVPWSALEADPSLARLFATHTPEGRRALEGAVDSLVRRGLFVRAVVGEARLVVLNSPRDLRALERSGGVAEEVGPPPAPGGERPSIFRLYEENIGVLTPMVGEHLRALEGEYPWAWIVEAFREAVRQNKRRLAYVEAILRRWKEEGRDDGAPGRHPEKVSLKDYGRWRAGRSR